MQISCTVVFKLARVPSNRRVDVRRHDGAEDLVVTGIFRVAPIEDASRSAQNLVNESMSYCTAIGPSFRMVAVRAFEVDGQVLAQSGDWTGHACAFSTVESKLRAGGAARSRGCRLQSGGFREFPSAVPTARQVRLSLAVVGAPAIALTSALGQMCTRTSLSESPILTLTVQRAQTHAVHTHAHSHTGAMHVYVSHAATSISPQLSSDFPRSSTSHQPHMRDARLRGDPLLLLVLAEVCSNGSER